MFFSLYEFSFRLECVVWYGGRNEIRAKINISNLLFGYISTYIDLSWRRVVVFFLGAIMVSHRWNLNHLPQIVFENLSKVYGIYIKLKKSSNLIRMRKENTFKTRENTCWKNKQRNPISVSYMRTVWTYFLK